MQSAAISRKLERCYQALWGREKYLTNNMHQELVLSNPSSNLEASSQWVIDFIGLRKQAFLRWLVVDSSCSSKHESTVNDASVQDSRQLRNDRKKQSKEIWQDFFYTLGNITYCWDRSNSVVQIQQFYQVWHHSTQKPLFI